MTKKALVAVIAGSLDQQCLHPSRGRPWCRPWGSPASRSPRCFASSAACRHSVVMSFCGAALERGVSMCLAGSPTSLKRRRGEPDHLCHPPMIAVAVGRRNGAVRYMVSRSVPRRTRSSFWSGFLKALVRRGLKGVKLVLFQSPLRPRAGDLARVLSASLAALPDPLDAQHAWPMCPKAGAPSSPRLRQAFLQADPTGCPGRLSSRWPEPAPPRSPPSWPTLMDGSQAQACC